MDGDKIMNHVDLPKDPSVILHLAESVQEVAHGRYESANKLFHVASSETEKPELKRLAETLGLMCVKVEGREYQLELMLEELKKKKEELETQMALRVEGGFLFTTVIVVLCLYFAILYKMILAGALTNTAKACMMQGVIATILFFSVIYIKHHHRPWRDWGFTLAGSAASLRLAALTGLPLAAAGIMWKWHMVGQAGSQHFGHPVFEPVDLAWTLYYIPLSFIQEMTVRGIMQTAIERILPGQRAAIMAIIVTSLIFAIMHLFYSAMTVLVTLLASLYFGLLYYRHRTLVGVFAAHYLLGLLFVFALRLIAW